MSDISWSDDGSFSNIDSMGSISDLSSFNSDQDAQIRNPRNPGSFITSPTKKPNSAGDDTSSRPRKPSMNNFLGDEEDQLVKKKKKKKKKNKIVEGEEEGEENNGDDGEGVKKKKKKKKKKLADDEENGDVVDVDGEDGEKPKKKKKKKKSLATIEGADMDGELELPVDGEVVPSTSVKRSKKKGKKAKAAAAAAEVGDSKAELDDNNAAAVVADFEIEGTEDETEPCGGRGGLVIKTTTTTTTTDTAAVGITQSEKAPKLKKKKSEKTPKKKKERRCSTSDYSEAVTITYDPTITEAADQKDLRFDSFDYNIDDVDIGENGMDLNDDDDNDNDAVSPFNTDLTEQQQQKKLKKKKSSKKNLLESNNSISNAQAPIINEYPAAVVSDRNPEPSLEEIIKQSNLNAGTTGGVGVRVGAKSIEPMLVTGNSSTDTNSSSLSPLSPNIPATNHGDNRSSNVAENLHSVRSAQENLTPGGMGRSNSKKNVLSRARISPTPLDSSTQAAVTAAAVQSIMARSPLPPAAAVMNSTNNSNSNSPRLLSPTGQRDAATTAATEGAGDDAAGPSLKTAVSFKQRTKRVKSGIGFNSPKNPDNNNMNSPEPSPSASQQQTQWKNSAGDDIIDGNNSMNSGPLNSIGGSSNPKNDTGDAHDVEDVATVPATDAASADNNNIVNHPDIDDAASDASHSTDNNSNRPTELKQLVAGSARFTNFASVANPDGEDEHNSQNQQSRPTELLVKSSKSSLTFGSRSEITCPVVRTTAYLNAVRIAQGSNPKVLCASADSTIHIHSILDGKQYPSLEGHTDRVISLAVSNPFYFYERPAAIAEEGSDEEEGGSNNNNTASSQPKKKLKTLVASGSRDQQLKIWDLDSGKCLHSIRAHKSPIWAVAMAVRQSGDVIIVSTSGDGSMRSWNGKTGKKLVSFKGHTDKILTVFILNPLSENPLVFSGGADKKIRVWELLTGVHIRMYEGHEDEINSVVAGAFSGISSLVPISDPDAAGALPGLNSGGQQNNTDGKSVIIVSGSRDLTVKVWDYKSGHLLFELLGHSACVYEVSLIRARSSAPGGISPGTPVIVSCSEDATVRLWNLVSGKQIKSLKWHSVSVRGIDTAALIIPASTGSKKQVDPDAPMKTISIIASCGWDKTIQFHEIDEVLGSGNDSCCTVS